MKHKTTRGIKLFAAVLGAVGLFTVATTNRSQSVVEVGFETVHCNGWFSSEAD